MGCSDNAVSWFKSYLTNRQQKVCYKNGVSSFTDIDIGIPQGSILGPLLFTVYINDLPEALPDIKVDMYADDTTLHIAGNNHLDVVYSLQSAMDRLLKWLEINRLVLNVDKTKLMFIGSIKKLNLIQADEVNVNVKGKTLEVVDSAKILGMHIDSQLKFDKHVDSITQKISGTSVANNDKLFNLQKRGL